MSLKSYAQAVDGTIPVRALLYDDEQLLASQEGVGIYEGNQKSPAHQSGTIHASTHRLFYIDGPQELYHSFALDLSLVNRTDFYAGLFTSNPKVTLFFSPLQVATAFAANEEADSGTAFNSWECQVCAYKNPPGLSPSAANVCGLCGVPRDAPALRSASDSTSVSSSVPSSRETRTSLVPQPLKPAGIACPACTFLNHSSLRRCEICDTELPRSESSTGGGRAVQSNPTSKSGSPLPSSDDEESIDRIIKISFRKGGEKDFYAVLKLALQRRAWQKNSSTGRKPTPPGDPGSSQEGVKSGISGILLNVESSVQGREMTLTDALMDLEALRIKAQDMVQLAAELNEKLTAVSSTQELGPSVAEDMNARDPHVKVLTTNEPEEASFIRTSMSQLGLHLSDAPITMDMMKDESKWLEELAKELGSVLQGGRDGSGGRGMMKDTGILALDEVWGGWNRARGVALIPPSTFLLVLPLLRRYTNPPIRTRKFSSGLTVLHTPQFSNSAFSTRLCSFLVEAGPHTTMEIAMQEGLNISMASMLLDSMELSGDVVRDDVGLCAIVTLNKEFDRGGTVGLGEVEWYPNLFTGYKWDGDADCLL